MRLTAATLKRSVLLLTFQLEVARKSQSHDAHRGERAGEYRPPLAPVAGRAGSGRSLRGEEAPVRLEGHPEGRLEQALLLSLAHENPLFEDGARLGLELHLMLAWVQ